jgi:DNA-binding NtrC family response regulator
MSQTKNGDSRSVKPTIFVVDDEPMLLDMAEAILEPMGFAVRKFRDPRKALLEITEARPVLIVTDYSMGAMNGVEFVCECKRRNPAQKMLLVSGTVDETIYADSPLKPDRFLAKPYAVADFMGIIQSLTKA